MELKMKMKLFCHVAHLNMRTSQSKQVIFVHLINSYDTMVKLFLISVSIMT